MFALHPLGLRARVQGEGSPRNACRRVGELVQGIHLVHASGRYVMNARTQVTVGVALKERGGDNRSSMLCLSPLSDADLGPRPLLGLQLGILRFGGGRGLHGFFERLSGRDAINRFRRNRPRGEHSHDVAADLGEPAVDEKAPGLPLVLGAQFPVPETTDEGSPTG